MPYSADPYRGDRYLFEGIASAGAGVSRGLQQAFDRMEQQKEEEKRLTSIGKAADAFATAAPDFLNTIGHTPESWKNVGAREKAAAMEGFVQSKSIQALTQRIAAQQQAMEQEAALGEALARYATGPRPPLAAAAGPDSEEKRRAFAMSTPRLGGSGSMRLLEGLSRMGKESLPLGQTLPLPGIGTLVGTGGAPQLVREADKGWNLQPGAVIEAAGRKLVPVSPNSFQVVDDKAAGAEGDPVPSWVFTDDDEEFKRGMKNITDAPQAKLLNTLRAGYLRGSGRSDSMVELLQTLTGGSAPRATRPAESTAAKPAFRFVPGQGLVPVK